ncbi:ATP-binding cassette, subfamily B [Nakamurella panacisegetis]|uniref:ATP-binding cassette, subfamily B n=2 Tax=Nakamurella panacisegetis TaxID=1090615 RepID=A0A1H0HFY6_9ACTN|nr:ABC transporter ATP-binding protein [Nakamurella panacisegetis]SDO18037.1 ATP-binding cassette, subfamily B [Nakamurella panacisegetis]
MSGPMGGGSMAALRAMHRDDSVKDHKLPPGIAKRILAFARPYRKELILFLTVTVFSAVIAVATPLLAGQVVNEISGHGQLRVVIILALVIAALAVVDTGNSLVSRFYSSRIGEGLIYDMRSRVFDHVQKMSLSFFTRTQTGALVSRLNNDVIGAQQAFTSTLSGVVSNVIGLVLTAGVMFSLSWQVTVLSLILLPVFVLPARAFGRKLQTLTRESYGLNASMTTTMTERFNVSGALLVALFGRPEEESKSFAERAGRVRDIGVTTAMYGRTFIAALTLVAALAQALTYGLGGSLALSGSLNAGNVVALALLLTRLYGPLTALSNVRVDVMSALVSFERVFEVLDLEPLISERPDAVVLPKGSRSVEFDDVRFAYPSAEQVSLASLESISVPDHSPRHPVLHGVSFRAEPGQLVALVGPSGAGKTTISQLIPRIYDADSGAVRIGGVDVKDATLQSLRDSIGVVAQDAHMFHDTIRANLLYARPEASEAQLIEALRAAQIWPLVSSLPEGLETVVGDRGHRLSGGEKQRLAIARVLLKAPDVVILDEATAHLDSESEAAVQRALDAALTGRTSIVIAHRLSTVRSADQILVIDRGRVVESGRHADLIARNGLYADLYRTQFEDQARTQVSTPE